MSHASRASRMACMSRMTRRLARAATAAPAALVALVAVTALAAPATGAGMSADGARAHARTQLTITVSGSGHAGADGVFRLRCAPPGGSHPAARAACDRLDELAGRGAAPFAPVARDALCTMQFGGPATARITGTWRGRGVDAAFDRSDGCEISRWNTLRPVLPEVG
ncbi:SSI family serine proteinase inhibitor [Streptomyces sp. NPDC015144]|uniref:SSI family serine proteinase inhibitor n=1 Tax=Streptomyces sp. NPDC015144 TaxID=3364944 RepID=UPI0036FE95FB